MKDRPSRPLGVRRRLLDALVRQVADDSLDAVCRLVAARVETMTLCEARGYIRARAAREVRRQVRAAIARHPVAQASWELPLVVRATERVAPLALREIIGARLRSGSVRDVSRRQSRRAA
jgi:hypothetical protein